MRMFLISDNTDTRTGMKLAGIDGVVVHGRKEALAALTDAMKDESIGIVLVTELLAELFPEMIAGLKSNNSRPLIVEVPDRHGTRRPHDYIMRYVNGAIGAKL